MEKKLYRDEQHKMVGGVCAGLAEYFDMDPTVIRLIFAFTIIFMGVGLFPYIIMWIVLPKKGYDFSNYGNPGVDYTVPPVPPATPNNPFGEVITKRKSNAGLIVGVIMICLGALFLLNEFDLFPDWDFDRLWPLGIVVAGIALIVAGQRRKPWQDHNWHVTPDEKTEPAAEDNSSNDNHPNV